MLQRSGMLELCRKCSLYGICSLCKAQPHAVSGMLRRCGAARAEGGRAGGERAGGETAGPWVPERTNVLCRSSDRKAAAAAAAKEPKLDAMQAVASNPSSVGRR